MKFSELLAKVGLKPKTLDTASATIADVTPALNSVASLFAAANLDLDAMLAAGPDSLKAHLDAVGADDGELAKAQKQVETLTAELKAKEAEIARSGQATITAGALSASMCAAINFDPAAKDAAGNPMDFKEAFGAHVAKEAAGILAKDGRPALTHQTATAPGKEGEAAKDPAATGRERYKADFNAQLKKLYPRR